MNRQTNKPYVSITVRNREELESAIQSIERDPSCQLHKSIHVKMYRAGIASSYDASEIYQEAVFRAIQHIDKKGAIPNIVGWLNLAAYRIILENRREVEKYKKTIQSLSNRADFLGCTEANSDISEKIRVLRDLLKQLDLEDQWILLSASKGMKWKEVCEELAKKGFIAVNIASQDKTIERVKKRGNRLMSKLKVRIEEATRK